MSERKKIKIQRLPGIELPGLGKPGALDKRNYPPGQHGRLNKPKPTQFGVRKARSLNASNWMKSLIGLLERRLDNIVFRLGFARSLAAASQLVSRRHVLVNDEVETIGSMVLRPGAVTWLTDRASQLEVVQSSLRSPWLPLPSYLRFQDPDVLSRGILLSIPGSSHVPFEFNKTQAAEYYARRGV